MPAVAVDTHAIVWVWAGLSSHPSGMRCFGCFLFRGCRSAKPASRYPRLICCHPSGMALEFLHFHPSLFQATNVCL